MMARIYYGIRFGTDRTPEDEQALCRLAAAAVFNLPDRLTEEKPKDTAALPVHLPLAARRLAALPPPDKDADIGNR